MTEQKRKSIIKQTPHWIILSDATRAAFDKILDVTGNMMTPDQVLCTALQIYYDTIMCTDLGDVVIDVLPVPGHVSGFEG